MLVLIVGIRDGSLLYAKSVEADAEHLEIETIGGVKLAGGTRDDVVALQSLGGDFVYLSDLEPADYRHVPYLEIPWPYQRDRNLAGEPLRVGGKMYLKGIAMHSAARLTYRPRRHLSPLRRRRSPSTIRPAIAAACRLPSICSATANGRRRSQSGVVRGGAHRKRVSVDLSGAAAMTLTVDYADRGDELDHADWLDARLVK